jgi:hypothetical protein
MECHHPNWRTPWFFRGVVLPPTKMIGWWWKNMFTSLLFRWVVPQQLPKVLWKGLSISLIAWDTLIIQEINNEIHDLWFMHHRSCHIEFSIHFSVESLLIQELWWVHPVEILGQPQIEAISCGKLNFWRNTVVQWPVLVASPLVHPTFHWICWFKGQYALTPHMHTYATYFMH